MYQSIYQTNLFLEIYVDTNVQALGNNYYSIIYNSEQEETCQNLIWNLLNKL